MAWGQTPGRAESAGHRCLAPPPNGVGITLWIKARRLVLLIPTRPAGPDLSGRAWCRASGAGQHSPPVRWAMARVRPGDTALLDRDEHVFV
jgi:hypothetical protein